MADDDNNSANGRPRNPKAHLLGLPQELRDIIIHQLIIKSTNTITMLPNFGCHANEISAEQPPICKANRQLRNETLPTFYSANTFTAQLDNDLDLECAKAWLEAIGNHNIEHLRRITMCGWTRAPHGLIMTKVTLDLKLGVLDIESMKREYGASGCGEKDDSTEVAKGIEELKGAFKEVYDARCGKPFDFESMAGLMDGFNSLCTGY